MTEPVEPSKLQSAEAVWTALAGMTKGPERAALLEDDRVRNLILNSGAFVVLSTGAAAAGNTLQERLTPVRVLQTHRLRTLKTGDIILDGRGTFGGLSERSRKSENLLQIPLKELLSKTVNEIVDEVIRPQLQKILNFRDDLAVDARGRVVLVEDADEIGRATVAREMLEEGADELGLDITSLEKQLGVIREQARTLFNAAALVRVPLQHVRDDNYIINIWDGDLARPAYAVTPMGYLRSLDAGAFDLIAGQGRARLAERSAFFKEKKEALKGMEILGVEDVPLFDALKQWGKSAGGGRDLSHDYRYPHEWLSVWHKAGETLAASVTPEERAKIMIALAREAQASVVADAKKAGQTPHNIDFAGALAQMNGGSAGKPEDLHKFDLDFRLPPGTFIEMHKAAERVMADSGYSPNNPAARHFLPARGGPGLSPG